MIYALCTCKWGSCVPFQNIGFEADFQQLLLNFLSRPLKPDCLSVKEASEVVDVQNIRHIAENQRLIGNVVEKTVEDWNLQRELFYQQTRLNQQLPAIEAPQPENTEQCEASKQQGNEDFQQPDENELFVGNEDNENSEQVEDISHFGEEIEQLLTEDALPEVREG